jgi:hypothetical protein
MKQAILTVLAALFALSAYASEDRYENRTRDDPQSSAESNATGVRGDVSGGAGGDATAISEGSAATIGDVSGGNASNEGVNIGGDTISNETNFFAFSTTFPQASGCFGGAQGGGGSGSGGGFLGLHFLNNDCWTSALAEAEANADVRARLKCGGKKFRSAIAFDQRDDKQVYCVHYMVEVYTREIEHVKEQVKDAVKTGAITEVSGKGFGYMMAQVSEEEFDEQAKETAEEIAKVRAQAEAAEARAKEAEEKIREYELQEQVKYGQLQQLQQQVREDYERIKPKEK